MKVLFNDGNAAAATTGTAASLVITAPASPFAAHEAIVTNEGTAAGFISFDGGASYPFRLTGTPAGVAVVPVRIPIGLVGLNVGKNVMIKRDSADMSGVFVSIL